jgi:hypothetical protein
MGKPCRPLLRNDGPRAVATPGCPRRRAACTMFSEHLGATATTLLDSYPELFCDPEDR